MNLGDKKPLFSPGDLTTHSDTFYLPVGGQISVVALGLEDDDTVTFEIVLVPAEEPDLCPCSPGVPPSPKVAATATLTCCDDPVTLTSDRPVAIIDAPQNARFRAILSAANRDDIWVWASATETKNVTSSMRGCSCPMTCEGITADATWLADADDPYSVDFFGTAQPSISGFEIDEWIWDFGYTKEYGQNISHTFDASGVYPVALTAVDDAGCRYTTIVMVEVIGCEGIHAAFTSTKNGLDVVFTDHSVASDQANINSWEWTFGDGNSSTSASPAHTYDSPGTYLATLTVRDSKGCVDYVSHSVTVEHSCDGINAQFSATANQFTVSANPAGSTPSAGASITRWRWDWGDGSVDSGAGSKSHIYSSAGTYTITLTIEDSNGCTDTAQRQVVVQGATPCAGIRARLNASINERRATASNAGSSPSTGQTITSWTWDWGDGNSDSGPGPHTHDYSNDGTYTITLTIVDSDGCSDSASRVVVARENGGGGDDCQIEADFTFDANVFDVSFEADASTTCDDQTISYEWEIGGSVVSTSDSFTHDFGGAGEYDVALTVTDTCGCQAEVTKTVVVESDCDIAVDFNVKPDGESVEFESVVTSSCGDFSYVWKIDGVEVSTADKFTHVFDSGGTYSVFLEVTDDCDCVAGKTKSVEVEEDINPSPGISILRVGQNAKPAELTFRPNGTWGYTGHNGQIPGGPTSESGAWARTGVDASKYEIRFFDLQDLFFNTHLTPTIPTGWLSLASEVKIRLDYPSSPPATELLTHMKYEIRDAATQQVVYSNPFLAIAIYAGSGP